MKKWLLRALLLYIPGSLLALILLTTGLAWQQGLLTPKIMSDLAGLVRSQGLMTTITIVRMEVFGTGDQATDPGYGRQLVPGRGHAPWVLRSNLDDKPRMLSFALAPNIWAAYDIDNASLYQVWRGDVLWQGAHYDYRHGPQPETQGEFFLRHEDSHQWYLQRAEDSEPRLATVEFLGHEYGPERATAALRYRLSADGDTVDLLENPELDSETNSFRRHFTREKGSSDLKVLLDTGAGAIALADHPVLAMEQGQAIINEVYTRSLDSEDSQLQRGLEVIENSDCLSCHSEQHQVAGPPWARIAGRYRGYVQDESLQALADSIRQGSSGKWGSLVMTPHPEIPDAQARDAAAYILTRATMEIEADIPVDETGTEYQANRDFDVGKRLESVHPAFQLENLLPAGFEPKVGGMDFREDGKLLLSSWDGDGTVFLLDLDAQIDQRVLRIAEGLHEPLGLAVVGDRQFVLQKQEVTELIDHDGDELIDEYRVFSTGWPVTANFHSFAFGLMHRQGYLYATLSICVMPGGASCPEQQPSQGKLLKMSLADGSWEIVASGFRTPNGVGLGIDEEIFVTDNQGDWLPANKLVHIREGGFYGSRAVPDPDVMTAQERPPVVWLAQDEIGNSPTQPLALREGPYYGQLIYGDVTHGGIKRVFYEQIGGELQGAVFRFSAGFQGGVNRLVRGPDGAIYVGEVGSRPNWSEIGKTWHGLERLSYSGPDAFELLRVRAQPDGFTLTFTEPLGEGRELLPTDLSLRQWFYHPTEQYGGPKYDDHELVVKALEVSTDRRSVRVRVDGLKPGYVVYLRVDEGVQSASGQTLWTHEAWYTLNQIPELEVESRAPLPAPPEDASWTSLFDGKSLDGWRNYGSSEQRQWQAIDGELTFVPGSFPMLSMIRTAVFGGGSTDLIYGREKFRNFELELEWKISAGGNSGIFYLVADERHNMPWETGLEMQVLDNEGHSDGQIQSHRAGDLYDLVAAQPETVKQPGEWNRVKIRIQDNRIEHWLNGEKVVDIERGGAEWEQRMAVSKFTEMPDFGQSDNGYIVLQDHGDPVWYRNIRIRRLPSLLSK
jgi:cytochrome c551/c552